MGLILRDQRRAETAHVEPAAAGFAFVEIIGLVDRLHAHRGLLTLALIRAEIEPCGVQIRRPIAPYIWVLPDEER